MVLPAASNLDVDSMPPAGRPFQSRCWSTDWRSTMPMDEWGSRALHRALICHLRIRIAAAIKQLRQPFHGQVARKISSQNNKNKGHFQGLFAAPSLGLEPGWPRQKVGMASPWHERPGLLTWAPAWANPEVYNCANAVATVPISWVFSSTSAWLQNRKNITDQLLDDC